MISDKESAQPEGWANPLFGILIFFSGGHSTPDMTLGFIVVQYVPHLFVQTAIVLR